MLANTQSTKQLLEIVTKYKLILLLNIAPKKSLKTYESNTQSTTWLHMIFNFS